MDHQSPSQAQRGCDITTVSDDDDSVTFLGESLPGVSPSRILASKRTPWVFPPRRSQLVLSFDQNSDSRKRSRENESEPVGATQPGPDVGTSSVALGDSDDEDVSTKPSSSPSLTAEQQYILNVVVEQKRNVFLSGGAGTGKSFLLREIVSHLDKRTTFLTAPTGIAALNLGGTTIHSFAGIGKGQGTISDLVGMALGNRHARNNWKQCRVLVIDEISMLSPQLLDALEFIARRARGRNEPFGGIQLVLCGDFLQLPPVKDRGTMSEFDFCFETQSWVRINPRVFILRTVFRQQSDSTFANVLNELRIGQLSQDSVHVLMSASRSTRVAFVDSRQEFETADDALRIIDAHGESLADRLEGKTVLRATNAVVKDINGTRFAELATQIYAYEAADSGLRKELVRANCPADDKIALRVGARVMLLKNIDVGQGLVNGSVGTVQRFVPADDVHIDALNPPSSREWLRKIAKHQPPCFPVVRFTVKRYSRSSRQVENVELDLIVQPQSWTVTSGSTELACRWQVPLKLAWAITIHKSQGMTLSDVNVDFDGMFEDGQAYVALSRCTTLEGCSLENFDLRRIKTNLKALAFYDELEQSILDAGGDASMYTAPTAFENPWGSTQESLSPESCEEDEDETDKHSPTCTNENRFQKSSASTPEHARRAVALKKAMERLRRLVPSVLLREVEAATVALTTPHLASGSRTETHFASPGKVNRKISDLRLSLDEVRNCFVIIDTCSLIALHREPPLVLSRLCNDNFVRVPQSVLTELDCLTKRSTVAVAARHARNAIETLLEEGLLALQGSDETEPTENVFAVGGASSQLRDDLDYLSRCDNPILCFGAFLRNRYDSAVVICTEDIILSLRARACGFSCTLIGGR